MSVKIIDGKFIIEDYTRVIDSRSYDPRGWIVNRLGKATLEDLLKAKGEKK